MDREPPSASLIKESKSAHKREIEDNLLEVEECLNAKVKVLEEQETEIYSFSRIKNKKIYLNDNFQGRHSFYCGIAFSQVPMFMEMTSSMFLLGTLLLILGYLVQP